MQEMEKVIVVLSGGMDSAVVLCKLLEAGYRVACLSFDYGSKHAEKELKAAAALTNYYGIADHLFYKLNFSNFISSNLMKEGGAIPDGHYEADSMKQTVVPFRNGIMLSLAIGYAESKGFDAVAIGAHTGDHHIYPDCRPNFLEAMRQAAFNGTDRQIKLMAPLSSMSKMDIAKLGHYSGVPFEKTWTCYKGRDLHCGVCGSCTERKEAFNLSHIPDPTVYEK